MVPASAQAPSGQPITIGFGMALTGPLAANGKQALLGAKIWEETINKKGGLLGRPVKLIYYDDQSNPSTVPGIYTKLLDVDKVDLVTGPYATAMIAPAMPVVMQKGKVFIGLFGLAVNSEFNYPKYFAMIPSGPETKPSFTQGLLRCRRAAEPQAADGRAGRRRPGILAQRLRRRPRECQGGRHARGLRQDLSAHDHGLLADRARDPGHQSGYRLGLLVPARLRRHGEGGERDRLQAEDDRRRHGRSAGDRVQDAARPVAQRLGQLRDLGAVGKDADPRGQGVPGHVYQSRAAAEGVDPLGYYLGTWGYAYMELLGNAIAGAKSINDDQVANYLRSNPVKTIMGDIKFGKGGEWAESRMLQVQYHDIKGNTVDQFKGMDTQTVLTPADLKTGNIIYPYEKAK